MTIDHISGLTALQQISTIGTKVNHRRSRAVVLTFRRSFGMLGNGRQPPVTAKKDTSAK